MKFQNSQDVLSFWESCWGSLPQEWKTDFLSHPAVKKILYFPDDWITKSIGRNIKLDAALKLLEKSVAVHYPEYSPAPPWEEIETPEEYAERMEREALLKSRKIRERPKPIKPNPKDIQPLTPYEVTMESLRNQPGERHWW